PDGATLATALGELGKTLPEPRGVDWGVVAAFALVILFVARAIARDVESFQDLSADAPPVAEELDEPSKAPLQRAEAKTIPTLDGMRGIAVLLVLMFHFAWTFPGEDPTTAVSALEKITTHVHAFLWSGWTGVDLFFVLSGYLITRGLVSPSKKVLG